jgi:hypothetical protein
MAMQSATILTAKNKKLRAANKKVQKKRQKRRSYVGRGGVLSAQEVQEAQRGVEIEVEREIQVVEQVAALASARAPRMCSICRSLDHTARTCPERQ